MVHPGRLPVQRWSVTSHSSGSESDTAGSRCSCFAAASDSMNDEHGEMLIGIAIGIAERLVPCRYSEAVFAPLQATSILVLIYEISLVSSSHTSSDEGSERYGIRETAGASVTSRGSNMSRNDLESSSSSSACSTRLSASRIGARLSPIFVTVSSRWLPSIGILCEKLEKALGSMSFVATVVFVANLGVLMQDCSWSLPVHERCILSDRADDAGRIGSSSTSISCLSKEHGDPD